MFTKRIIPCLDVKNARVVKGVNFVNLKDAGDPVEVAKAYDAAGADEVVFLDITASSDQRATVVDMVRQVAANVFIPFTVGGGIRTVEDFRVLLRAGADKISINSWRSTLRKGPTAVAGISISMAAELMWEWMQSGGRSRWRLWERAKFC